jgi:predicted cobalt transporter CbtA
MMVSSFGSLVSTPAFWNGVGRLIIDVLLIGVLFFVVMTVAGHPPNIWPTRRASRARPGTQRESEAEEPTAKQAAAKEVAAAKVAAPPKAAATGRRQSSEGHLEVLDKLRTTFQYQASTVVLIVFAVILLGIQRILSGPEIATILAGIAGFVLGQNKSQSDVASSQSGHLHSTAGDSEAEQ